MFHILAGQAWTLVHHSVWTQVVICGNDDKHYYMDVVKLQACGHSMSMGIHELGKGASELISALS